MARPKGRIFVLSAPSGCGKTSLVKALTLDKGFGVEHPPSFTTRGPRAGEKEGRDYCFVSGKDFLRRQKKGEFIETSSPYGANYGTSRKHIEDILKKGRDAVLSLDVKGALFIKKNVKGSVLIYVLPPSLEALRKRLVGRSTDGSSEIKKRMSYARKDISKLGKYDYAVVNDDFSEAVAKLKSIIVSERLKVR